jgi:O-antigen/teichoic acid export membrane protein
VTRRTTFALITTVVALAVCVGLNLLLVPQIGAAGAAVASAISFWLLFVTKTESSARIWHRYPRLRLHLLIGLAVALAVASVLIEDRVATLVPALWITYGVGAVLVCGRTWREMLTGSHRTGGSTKGIDAS